MKNRAIYIQLEKINSPLIKELIMTTNDFGILNYQISNDSLGISLSKRKSHMKTKKNLRHPRGKMLKDNNRTKKGSLELPQATPSSENFAYLKKSKNARSLIQYLSALCF